MADTFTTTRIDTPGTNGITRQSPTAAPIAVSFDEKAGTIGVPAMGDAPVDRRAAILERHAARMAAARGEPKPGVEADEHGVPLEQAAEPESEAVEDDEPSAEDVDAEVAAEDGAEVEAEPEADAEEQPETDEPSPATVYELEQARLELAAAQREIQDAKSGRREQDFDAYFDDPLAYMRNSIAGVLGLEPTDPLVTQEIESLQNKLTWSAFSDQDLPDSQKDQLRRDSLDRKIRLDAHRRQSEKKATAVSKEDAVAREIATTVFTAGADQFPDAARYAELLFRRPIGEIISDVLTGAVRDGKIQNWQNRGDADLFSEASRLLNDHCRNVARSKGLPVAPLTTATVPKTPGATPRPTAAQTAPSPAASKKAPTAKPRTLPQHKAGAAPSKPSTPQAAELPLDSESRRAAILQKAARGGYNR